MASRRARRMFALAGAIVCSLAGQARSAPSTEQPVQVEVVKEIRSKQVVYRYEVKNRSPFPITTIDIGHDRRMGDDELTVPPAGWADGHAAIQAPPGWNSRVEAQEDTLLLYVEWDIDSTSANLGVLPGKSLGGFVVTLPKEDKKYEQGSWTVYVDGEMVAYAGVLSSRPRKPSR